MNTYYIMKPDVNDPEPSFWVNMRTDFADGDCEHTLIAEGFKSSKDACLAADDHAGYALDWKEAYEEAVYEARA